MKKILKEFLQLVFTKKYIVYHGDRKFRTVALTFDDGPNPEYTSQVLDILNKHRIKATFFLLAKKLRNALAY